MTERVTGEPLPGASVFIEGTTLGSAANAEGRYLIPRLSAGSYVLIAANTRVESLLIWWPSGHQDVLVGVSPNQELVVIEGSSGE